MVDKCPKCGIEGQWNGTSLLVTRGDTGFFTPPLYRRVEFHRPGGHECNERVALDEQFAKHLNQTGP